MASKILGISAFYHDSAAALVVDGRMVFGVQEERFTRKKHDASFPVNAVKACLAHGELYDGTGKPLSPGELDAVVFYEKPFLKLERLLETHYAAAPRGADQFVSAMPSWLKEKLSLKKIIQDELRRLGPFDPAKTPLLFPEHHLSHSASAFYPSPFEEAAILTVDGVGEWAAGAIAHGRGREIKVLREQHFPHSAGLLYSAFTYYAGFKVNSGEYKLMGLAPYGDPSSAGTKKFKDLIYSVLADVKEDGSIRLNQEYFDYAAGLRMTEDDKWAALFGIPRREPETELTQEYCDLALAIQEVTEDIVFKLAAEAKKLTGARDLCMAGGVALNCVANGKLARKKLFEKIWVQPAAGDAGGALGCALAAHHLYFGAERQAEKTDGMRGAYMGPGYTEADTLFMAQKFGAVFEKCGGDLYGKAAGLLAAGSVVGWHQGREEWGPRALGNRSILCDARDPEAQTRLNSKIKYRESFRPFAPAVLAEDAADYFENGAPSPYMLSTDYLKKDRRRALPSGFCSLPLKEKLHCSRSDLQAVTHVDFSARVQTVHRETNPAFHRLLSAFKKLTGCGVVVNTSFNVRGEPIVCSPEDSYRCFMRTGMDYLVIGTILFDKIKQPAFKESGDWRAEYPERNRAGNNL